MDFQEIKSLLEDQGEALDAFQARHLAAVTELKAEMKAEVAAERREREGLELRLSRPGAGGSTVVEGNLVAERKAIAAFAKTGSDTEIKATKSAIRYLSSEVRWAYPDMATPFLV